MKLTYALAPVDNPLKGLVPYEGDVRRYFPHSMEFNYLPVKALVVGPGEYDWTRLDTLLDGIASRGHQAVFRPWLEYPGQPSGIPGYLVRDGLKVTRWRNTNTQPLPTADEETPDYSDRRLRTMLQEFVAAMGKRYDGDRRIGFITAGLLGSWGEWHTYPRTDLWASKAVQREVLDAYQSAFKITPILLRYPAGDADENHTSNVRRPFGYHDDSFAWATLHTGAKDTEWFYLSLLRRTGAAGLSKWKQQPIGGEIRPEAWGKVFDTRPGDAQIQNFARCVRETHASWLMDSGMFRDNPAERKRRAQAQVRRMGYEFHVPSASVTRAGQSLVARAEIVNRGVAPFYYRWPVEWKLAGPDGRAVRTVRGAQTLTGLLPGVTPRIWEQLLDVNQLPRGKYQVQMRIVNPLPNGKPLRFANAEQRPDGWLTLPSFSVS